MFGFFLSSFFILTKITFGIFITISCEYPIFNINLFCQNSAKKLIPNKRNAVEWPKIKLKFLTNIMFLKVFKKISVRRLKTEK